LYSKSEAKSAAVFVGESGLGPWQDPETQAFLNQFVDRQCPLIPVILPSVQTTPELPWMLANRHRVDFRETRVDPLGQLIWGITGKKAPLSKDQAVSKLTTPQRAEIFDVFLSCNSEDKPAVREIARKLAQNNLRPWLEEEQLRPGASWQVALEQQIRSIKSVAVFVGESGLGPWQNQELQAFLSEFAERQCPIIPVILPSVTGPPMLPWPLENRHWVDFRETRVDPLRQLIWGITGEKPAELSHVPDSEQPVTMLQTVKSRLPAGADEHITKKRLYPPLGRPPNPEEAAQLGILRKRVMEYWVEGVLRRSLHNELLLSLDKRPFDKAVDAPWKYTDDVSNAANSARVDHRPISAIYDGVGLLLILGAPGSGKTITLLNLTQTLLERARDDLKERVPVVLSLSSWQKNQPLADWISGELSEKYRVPRKIAKFWLEHHYLVPLLDGLDEVETRMQPDCVAAINAFIEGSNPSGLVVCCRLLEYQWLSKPLKLNGAICLEPLSPQEVSKYLDEGGPKLAALREALNADPVLQEQAQTPLMLNIMSLAGPRVGSNELTDRKGGSPAGYLKQIFGLYVEQISERIRKAKVNGATSLDLSQLYHVTQFPRELEAADLTSGTQPRWLRAPQRFEAIGWVKLVANA
jgi:TIR domain-containing protein/NACHT domain-containing protein